LLELIVLAIPLVNVPALIRVVPVYVFTPPKTSVPKPVFVKLPEPEIIPLYVNVVPEPTEKLPPLLPKVIPRLAESVKLAVVVCNVPPLNVKSLAVTLPGAVPKLVSALRLNLPPLIAVAPVYVFAPDKVSVPDPTLVTLPVPLMTPLNVVLVESFPNVKAAEPSVTVPLPANEPIESLKLNRFHVAPLATVTALLEPMAFAILFLTIPALIIVAPVYVFTPPKRKKPPEPAFVKFPEPVIIPLYVKVTPPTEKVPPLLPNVIPRFAESVKDDVTCKIPPFNVKSLAVTLPGAVPKFASACTLSVPPLIDVVPV